MQKSQSSKTPSITQDLIAAHGLKPEEYQKILSLIGREPSLTELGIFSAMWNEHCSYKSSKIHLKTLPTTAPWVIYGPGENAGVIDIGDGDALAFKMESHNHPSFIEPYQGAATGVGGILRDVFTMGARPIAALNALRFGDITHPKTRALVKGVVKGIGGYGNSFGVPTVGGEINFHPRYNGNILVNAMAIGHLRKDAIFTSIATGVGMPIVYLGAKTGRDGIHGATMASQSFGEGAEEKRPTVQVGDPFKEKCLLEACLELMTTGAVIAIQDMGAAGLTCSAVEMGAKGNLGVRLNLECVPCREEGMTAYEMMLSESQERMLMVLNPEKQAIAESIFKKWDLDFAVIGETTDDLRFRIFHHGIEEANLPIKELGDEAPQYNRPYVVPKPKPVLSSENVPAIAPFTALKTLITSPDLCSREWVWTQYDHLIRGETLQIPGGDAAVIRLPNSKKAIAATTDCTPRYCEASPFEGGKQAVAETYRNLSAVGATPLAITDNLNFGNPEKPEIMGQFAEAVRGIGEACKALDYPVVSGNVSLYNETFDVGILPTPAIGGVGVLQDWQTMMTLALKKEGDVVYCLGETTGWLGQSLYLRELCNKEEGAPPPVHCFTEKQHGTLVRTLIHEGLLTACHDISDGGLLIALTEMAFAGKKGLSLMKAPIAPHAFWFGEDQARYILTVAQENAALIEEKAKGYPLVNLGVVTKDYTLTLADEKAPLSLSELEKSHKNTFPSLFGA